MKSLRIYGLGAALLLGCGSVTIEPGTTSSSSSSGSGGATSSSASAGGSGGGGIFIGTGGSSTGPACGDPSVFVEITGDASQSFDASCQPEGYLLLGGLKTPPSPDVGFVLHACGGAGPIVLSMTGFGQWPGSTTSGKIVYVKDGVDYETSPVNSGTITVSLLEPMGGIIEGTFSGYLTPAVGNGAPLNIQGKFRVCHTYDITIV